MTIQFMMPDKDCYSALSKIKYNINTNKNKIREIRTQDTANK